MAKNKKARATIPGPLAAKALFLSDRTCCVCRVKGKSVQVHHIDEDPANNRIENLAVLCLECHTETQMSGDFRRKLDAEQVILYRNDGSERKVRIPVNVGSDSGSIVGRRSG